MANQTARRADERRHSICLQWAQRGTAFEVEEGHGKQTLSYRCVRCDKEWTFTHAIVKATADYYYGV